MCKRGIYNWTLFILVIAPFLAIICSGSVVSANPQINFTNFTDISGSFVNRTNIFVNVSVVSSNLTNMSFNWNGTNYSVYDNSLILMYNFDNRSSLGENNTRIVDLSRYSNNATVNNATFNATGGKYGGGYMFNATASNPIAIPNSAVFNTSNFSISFWVKTNVTTSLQAFISKGHNLGAGSGTDQGWSLGTGNAGTLRWDRNDGVADLVLSTGAGTFSTANVWQFITLVHSSDNATSSLCSNLLNDKIYINGVEASVGTNTIVQNTSNNCGSIIDSNGLVLGQSSSNSAQALNGTLDELKIWNRTLSADEIKQAYFRDLYKFNQTQWYLYVNESLNSSAGLPDANYSFSSSVLDSDGLFNQTETRSVVVYSNVPSINIVYPVAGYNSNVSSLNYTISSVYIQSCWYSLNSGLTNTTIVCGDNVTGLASTDGRNVWTIYANDSFGSAVSSSSIFFIDSSNLSILFVSPAEALGSFINRPYLQINSSISGNYLYNLSFNWNGTNYSVYDNSLLLMYNFDNRSSLGENDTNVADLSIYLNNATVIGNSTNMNSLYGFFDEIDEQQVLNSSDDSTTSSPHSISLVRPNASGKWFGHTYWAYIGPQLNGTVDLRWSEDLVNWTDSGYNPIISREDIRWPSVIYENASSGNGTFWMIHTEDYLNDPYLVLENSSDGINFSFVKNITSKVVGDTKQNPYLYWDNLSGNYFLYFFYKSTDSIRHINVRSASSILGLNDSPEISLIGSNSSLAAPSLFYSHGLYWLQAESLVKGTWTYTSFYSSTPNGTFTSAHYNIPSGDACPSPYVSGNILYNYACNFDGSIWNVNLIRYNLTNSMQVIRNSGNFFYFDGSANESIRLNASINLVNKNFTLMAWIRPDDLSSQSRDIFFGSNGKVSMALNYSSISCLTNNDSWNTVGDLVVATWQQVACVYDGTNMTFYVNGVRVGSKTDNYVNGVDSYIAIGGGSNTFYGAIDEPRIFGRALNIDEIKERYFMNLNKYNSTQWYFYVNQSLNVSTGLREGNYTFSVNAYSPNGNLNQTAQRNVTIDMTTPLINLTYPLNRTYSVNVTDINYDVSDADLQACWYSLNSGLTNTTMACGHGVSGLTSVDGTNIWTVYTNDSAGNINSSSVAFVVSIPAGSNGGGGATAGTAIASSSTASDLITGYSKVLGISGKTSFTFKNETHQIVVDSFDVKTKTATITVYSNPQTKTLSVGEEWKVNLDNDSYYDLLVRLDNVTSAGAGIFMKFINESIPNLVNEQNGNVNGLGKNGFNFYVLAFVVLLIILFVIWFIHKKGKR